MDEHFSLQTLYNFIHRMLIASEETKRTLELQCDEAKFALKPWLIESKIVKQVDKNICSCEEDPIEKPEEIAEEISKALLHSQQLREKLALNLNKERQESRKPDLRQIYTQSQSQSQPLRESNSNPRQNNKSLRRSISQHRQSNEQPRTAKQRSISAVRFGDENIPGKKSRIMAQKQLRPSRDNDLARITTAPRNKTKETNFILANKLSVRGAKSAELNKRPSKPQPLESRRPPSSKNLKQMKMMEKNHSRSEENISELESLIKKFATSTTVNTSNRKADCPVHSSDAPSFIEEKVVTSVDAIEGLDRIGVPSSLVSILKIYHAYVRAEVFQDSPEITKRNQDSIAKFMSNFEEINNKRNVSSLNDYQVLLTGFSALYNESYKENFSKHSIKKLKSSFFALGELFDQHEIKSKAGELKFVKSSHQYEYKPDFMGNWISNGIWNFFCIPDMKGIFGSHCIRYSEREELVLFYDFIHKIQRKVYEIELIELIMMTVIPKLKESFDPESPEFIEMYKMIVTAVQIMNPIVPVLAKTDSQINGN